MAFRPGRGREVGGLALLVLSGVTLLGLLGVTSGALTDWWDHLLRRAVGLGAFPLTIALGSIGWHLLVHPLPPPARWPWRRLIGLEVASIALLALIHQLAFPRAGWLAAQAGRGGGMVGWALSTLLTETMGGLPTILLLLVASLLGIGVSLDLSWHEVRAFLLWLADRAERLRQVRIPTTPSEADRVVASTSLPPRSPPRPRPSTVPRPRLITEAGKGGKAPVRRDPRLPPLDLLEADDRLVADDEEVQAKAEIIVQTLAQFGLPVTVREVRRGPAVTQFGLEPGYIERVGPNGEPRLHKVRVSQISALADDLALALAAPTLRVEAPVPGRPIVGVEVPNDRVAVVRLRGVMASRAFARLRSPLALALGRDVAGAPVVADLAAMPHLLIAGTTGSGKSVAISAMTTCLVMNNTPEDLRLVMIDPKMVELVRFNGLPHLYGHVEVELERIAGVLRWAVREMDERYKRFAAVEARHLGDYNRKMRRRRRPPLPRIVILVDELADLMMMAPQETEHALTRLAQMARATGIHLVVATQRPSTDVVTGLIKANFPARISFAVASQVDSRVILDTVGAEQLLGRGDMLFLNPELGHPVRLQGCFVSDREIEAVVSYWRTHWDREEEEAPWEEWLRRHAAPGERRDDLLEAAIALVRETGGASTSLLQRRLRIGYPRAARLMDELEAMGIIGPPEAGGRLREVLDDRQGGGGGG